MDLMGGVVVHAAGGDRRGYKPVQSPWLSSPDPVHFVRAMGEKFGFGFFYIADLDAIMGKSPNHAAIQKLLQETSANFWLDAGFKTMDNAPAEGRITRIIATETFADWDRPGDLSGAVVSVDMNRGRILCSRAGATLEWIMAAARGAGARRFIHMQLDAVGAGRFNRYKLLPPKEGEQWWAGGGVRDQEDIRSAQEAGYAGALVATALHEGGFGPGQG